jgi:hypothetical protein
MRRLLAMCFACALTACNMVEVSGAPLTETECAQLIDKIDQTFAEGLTEENLAEYEAAYDDRAESIAECVTDPTWDRTGFACAMKAKSEGELQRCVFKVRG